MVQRGGGSSDGMGGGSFDRRRRREDALGIFGKRGKMRRMGSNHPHGSIQWLVVEEVSGIFCTEGGGVENAGGSEAELVELVDPFTFHFIFFFLNFFFFFFFFF